jgi:hypothetical protein
VNAPLDVIAHPGASAERLLLQSEEHEPQRRALEERIRVRRRQWIDWIRGIRPAARGHRALQAMLREIVAYLRALDRDAAALLGAADGDSLLELANVELRLSTKAMNVFIEERGMARHNVDNSWTRLKRISAVAHVPLPPGVAPCRPGIPRAARQAAA